MMKTCTKCGVEKPIEDFTRLSKARGGGVGTECKQCANARAVAWQRTNPDKRAVISRRYCKNNPEHFAALVPQARQRASEARKRNPKKFAARSAAYRKAHPEKSHAWVAAWKKEHPARVAALNAARHAAKLCATPAWTNHIAVGEFYALAAIKTRATGFPWHVDHIVPLKNPLVCGLHTHYNLQVLPGAENIAKGNRHWPDMPMEYAVQQHI